MLLTTRNRAPFSDHQQEAKPLQSHLSKQEDLLPSGLLNFVIYLSNKLSTHHFPGETLQRILQSHPKADVCLRLSCKFSAEPLMYLKILSFASFH